MLPAATVVNHPDTVARGGVKEGESDVYTLRWGPDWILLLSLPFLMAAKAHRDHGSCRAHS